MALNNDYAALAAELTDALGLESPPLGITFSSDESSPVPRYESEMPTPNPDGRTGAVPAGCVFWMKGTERTFSTTEEDHGNCSVGSLTHGFKTLEQVAGNLDVQALLEVGWVSGDAVGQIPTVKDKPRWITYGPLEETKVDPDVAFVRVNGKQSMILHDSLPDLQISGKPQCHIVAIAKDREIPVISVGCMLSRVRTGMKNNEMTCALPAARLPQIIENIKANAGADRAAAAYAAEDSKRFK